MNKIITATGAKCLTDLAIATTIQNNLMSISNVIEERAKEGYCYARIKVMDMDPLTRDRIIEKLEILGFKCGYDSCIGFLRISW